MGSGTLRVLAALLSGAIFGLGLAVSGMMNPAKVIGFLDVAGDWDPTLAFVMGGALLVTVPAFRIIPRRQRPVLADGFDLPRKSAVDARLVGGAALFGVGWGLVGFCPGPAVAALATGLTPVFVFVAAMISGMAVHKQLFEGRPGAGGNTVQDRREAPGPARWT
ncbi:MAG TPA: YeeE/YedE family protein [Rubrobacteraceae bacterium]|jgi:uncharacterized membrane protein YedE/YeeE|nr:YeeE/YedE family protein [Rubrobacteraceae bacterium]